MINKDTVLFMGLLNELTAKSKNGILPRKEHCSDPNVTEENEEDWVWYDPDSVEVFDTTEYYKIIVDVILFDDDYGAYFDEETFPCLEEIQVRVVVRVRDGVREKPFIEIKDESEEFYIRVEDGKWYDDY